MNHQRHHLPNKPVGIHTQKHPSQNGVPMSQRFFSNQSTSMEAHNVTRGRTKRPDAARRATLLPSGVAEGLGEEDPLPLWPAEEGPSAAGVVSGAGAGAGEGGGGVPKMASGSSTWST